MALRSLAKNLTECEIGNGNRASYWFDNWTTLDLLIDYVGSAEPRILGISLTVTVAQRANSNRWKLSSSRARVSTLLTLRHILSNLSISLASRGSDYYKWGLPSCRSINFSTKKVWNRLRPTAPIKAWAKVIWFKSYVLRQAFTFWTANLNRLPIRERLFSWGMNISPICCFCNLDIETRDHLFLHCEYSEQLWDIIMHRLGQPSLIFHDWGSLFTWLSSVSHETPSKLKLMVCHTTIYILWSERNNRLFNNQYPTALFQQIDRYIETCYLLDIRGRVAHSSSLDGSLTPNSVI